MKHWLSRVWAWFVAHVAMLPMEPGISQEKQVQNKGGAVGFRWRF